MYSYNILSAFCDRQYIVGLVNWVSLKVGTGENSERYPVKNIQ